MIKIVTGNLMDAKEKYLCHQCNCITNRSKHLASTVFKAFPYADIYSQRKQPDKPGNIILRGDGSNQRYVVAMLGQYYPGRTKYPNSRKDGLQARLSYFKACLEQMKCLEGSFAFPWRIGCGAAGGNWDDYYQEIENFAAEKIDHTIAIYKLENCKEKKGKSLFET